MSCLPSVQVRPFESTDPPQRVGDDAGLGRQLRLVLEVFQGTPTALLVMGTGRGTAVSGRPKDTEQPCARPARSVLRNGSLYQLARSCAVNEHRPPVGKSAYPFPTRCDRLDLDSNWRAGPGGG